MARSRTRRHFKIWLGRSRLPVPSCGCWQDSEDSLPCSIAQASLQGCVETEAGFFKSRDSKESERAPQTERHRVFHTVFVRRVSKPSPRQRGGITQGHECRQAGSLGAILETACYSFFIWNVNCKNRKCILIIGHLKCTRGYAVSFPRIPVTAPALSKLLAVSCVSFQKLSVKCEVERHSTGTSRKPLSSSSLPPANSNLPCRDNSTPPFWWNLRWALWLFISPSDNRELFLVIT